ncbi:MAG: putative peptide maturation dehydrogenase [Gaiellaceae bacterium]
MTPARVRRSRYLLLRCEDSGPVDVGELLRGRVRVAPARPVDAVSVLKGVQVELTDEQLDVLCAVPADRWVAAEDAGPEEVVRGLLDHGLLVGDADEPHLAELRRRDELLTSLKWNFWGAVYASLTRWHDVEIPVAAEMDADELAAASAEVVERKLGPPPPAFYSREDATGVLELPPPPEREHGLYDLLRARKTTRGFDTGARMSLDELSTVLAAVYGVHGWSRFAGEHFTLKKSSPSGGSLHPVEVYPLVQRVEGVEPGLYHYRAETHALETLEPLAAAEAEALATRLVTGQSYFGRAHVLFVLAARLERSLWKYRRHDKSYATLVMDAAHLSQTLYLVAAELGLGAFVTLAINDGYANERLGLDGVGHATLAINGCGRPAPSNLEPEYLPYTPRVTVIDP